METYGTLTDAEYTELLAEIQGDNEELQEEEVSFKEASLEDLKPLEYIARSRENIRLIKQMAFNQADIRLDSFIGNHNISTLLDMTVAKQSRLIDSYQAFINKRLTKLLMPLIPKDLKKCYLKYPMSFIPSPGFLYKASQEFGEGYTFWAIPDIPYYFTQGTERELIAEFNEAFLFAVDEAVLRYHTQLKTRADKEVRNASFIIQKGIQTYFDLLKHKPLWFKMLYEKLTNKNLL